MGVVLVIAGNIFAMGTLAYMGITLNVLSSTLPIIITLTVVAIATQCMSRLAELKNKVLHRHRHLLIFKVKKDLVKSHWLATACTAIGFGALLESDTPIIRAYGLSVAISVMVACLVTIILQVALIVWFPLPIKRKFPMRSVSSIRFISKHRHALFASIVLCCSIFAFMGGNLNWSTILFSDLPANSQRAKDLAVVESKLGGSIPLEISIGKDGQKETWKDFSHIRKLDELVTTWRKKPGVASVVGLPDFLKATNTERRIASTSQALSETYFIFSMANENPLQNFLSGDGAHTRIMLRVNDLPSKNIESIISEFREQTLKEFPGYKFETAGMAATVHPINEGLSRELIYGFYIAMLWILAMLIFVFKSVRWTLFSAIPNLVPPALLLGGLAITQTPVKPSLAIIFAISLGIAFNNTVYVLLKLKKMIKGKNLTELPVDELMREEFGPCFISSCAVMAGFSVFLFSSFAMNQAFGGFMIFAVVAGLIGDLVLLPTLLYIFPQILLPRPKSETISVHEQVGFELMTPSTQKIVAGLLLIIGISLISQKAFSATADVKEILKKVQKTNMTPYEQVELTMKIQEADGSTKERTLMIKKKSDKEQKAMVKLLSPSDLKGVGLLTVSSKGGDENQWLYLPSEKRSRRIVGSNKKGRFLDSELNYEDLRASTYEDFDNKVIESKKDGDKEVTVVESTAKSNSESSYSKIKTWIDTATYRVLKTEYYGEDGKLLKVMTFSGYKKYKNLWRAQNISVKNVKKNRSTTLELKKFSMKKMSDGDFSMSALEEG